MTLPCCSKSASIWIPSNLILQVQSLAFIWLLQRKCYSPMTLFTCLPLCLNTTPQFHSSQSSVPDLTWHKARRSSPTPALSVYSINTSAPPGVNLHGWCFLWQHTPSWAQEGWCCGWVLLVKCFPERVCRPSTSPFISMVSLLRRLPTSAVLGNAPSVS